MLPCEASLKIGGRRRAATETSRPPSSLATAEAANLSLESLGVESVEEVAAALSGSRSAAGFEHEKVCGSDRLASSGVHSVQCKS